MSTLLDKLLTPEEIARRITASSGVQLTALTVREKARRLGIAKKIGRSPLISIEDIPALLQEERKAEKFDRRGRRAEADISQLQLLQKSRRKMVKKAKINDR